MPIVIADTATAFLARAQDWLMRAEFENTMLLGIARGVEAGTATLTAPPFFAVALDNDGAIVGAAVRTPPSKLLLSRVATDAVEPLARAVHAAMPDLHKLNGPEPTASAFADACCRLTGATRTLGMRQRGYVLHAVANDLPPVRGTLRPAHDSERDLALAWATAFRDEAMPGGDTTDLQAFVDRVYRLQRAFIWDDGGPVTMVAAGGTTANGATISFVYTPPALRRRGYATAAVAALSRRLLEGKSYCCLYTDLANPTSNAIYQAIGYRAVGDFNDHHLDVAR